MQVNVVEIHVFIDFSYFGGLFQGLFFLRGLSLSKFSKVYAYLGAYAYLFGEFFQGLCLFGGLRLLGSLEYFTCATNSYGYNSKIMFLGL